MDDREKRRRENDALQSAEGDPAFGQDARDFGVGGQDEVRPLDDQDAKLRKPDRDPTIPENQSASRSGR